MRVVLQVVQHAEVTVDGSSVGSIGRGYLLLVGVSDGDTEEICDRMADKISRLRIFRDENDKTNLSLADVHGEVLVVSQFTLYADVRHGNRPGFTGAGKPELANRLYERMIADFDGRAEKVAHGEFGADMKVSLLNDGPFTLVLDSDTLFRKG
jgi:D-tyrosyl-tRNA(Tyr) deacylase